jgi:hypothetical protein
MTDQGRIRVAVPRKGRPLAATLDRLAGRAVGAGRADGIVSTLEYEKAVTKGRTHPDAGVYDRLVDYSDLDDPHAPEYTLVRDDRDGYPRRIVFDRIVLPAPGEPFEIELIGREEPFRALRTHAFALGFDSADLVLEEVVGLRETGLGSLGAINERIDPHDTDVRVVRGLGDTVHHTLLATPDRLPAGATLDRDLVATHEGPLCVSPRYERLVEAVLGTRAAAGCEFVYPEEGREEEAAIADVGLGVYLTVTGSTARENGLVVGERLFPSETVLMENRAELSGPAERARSVLVDPDVETALRV